MTLPKLMNLTLKRFDHTLFLLPIPFQTGPIPVQRSDLTTELVNTQVFEITHLTSRFLD